MNIFMSMYRAIFNAHKLWGTSSHHWKTTYEADDELGVQQNMRPQERFGKKVPQDISGMFNLPWIAT